MHSEVMRYGLYVSWLLPVTLPLLMLVFFKQSWKSRITFVLVGTLLAIGVCVVSMLLAGFVLTPIYKAIGIDTALRSQGPVSFTNSYLNVGFYLLFNIIVTYLVLRRLAPMFARRLLQN